ncbi:MAG: hypothetical protein H6816_15245 [Phycisphaerales bacterium]|nr:hypothetical protein [Phycisphaerales bacterium]
MNIPLQTTAVPLPGPGARAVCAKHPRSVRRTWPLRVLVPVVALVSFSVLFVGVQELERWLAPTMSTGLRHAVLTGMAALVTAGVSLMIYAVMRRQQQQLANTARQLTRLLEAYQEHPQSAGRFENPHLVQCGAEALCRRTGCPLPVVDGQRCWQVMALRHPEAGGDAAHLTLAQCQACPVYRRSCPDELTELGEGINNLLYLLEEGAGEIGRMRDQMLEKQKMAAVGQVAAGVAHEICNPLASISSVVQVLRRQRDLTPHAGQLDVIDRHIQRISQIVRQLIEMTRPATEAWAPVDLRPVLDEVASMLELNPQASGVTFAVDAPAGLPLTYGCPEHLRQMVLNLALNALDAMPDGGTLKLSAEARDGDLIVEVGDTGGGIAAAVGRRVFEPFYTTKEPGRGTGLGLTVTYGIVQEHGGTIDYVSRPGAGTTFTVAIPIADQPMEKRHAADDRIAGRR